MNLTMATFLQLSLVLSGGEATNSPRIGTYDWAHKEVTETGQPMFVLVGAKWCPACVEMKENVVPVIRRRGLLRKVVYAYVDLDEEKRLGRELTSRGPIPQLITFRRTDKGWIRSKIIGGRGPRVVEAFINETLTLDQREQQAMKEAKGSEQPGSRQAQQSHRDGRST